jgi:hypothetical protein
MRPDLNAYAAREIFIGTMDHMVMRWLLKDRSYSLFGDLEEIFQTLLKAYVQNQTAAVSKPIPSENSPTENKDVQIGDKDIGTDKEDSSGVSRSG